MSEALKKYNIIYADPPWQFRVYSDKGKGRSAENHYPTMSIKDICELPIKELADDNCVLFMWITYPTLKEAMSVIESWGFKYKTVAFVWVKQNKKSPTLFWGLGYWTRANSEICILATKGSPKRVSAKVHQIIMTPVEIHSKKPKEVKERIVELLGDLPKIELFARQSTDGWDVWGNEIKSSINMKDYGGGENVG